MKPEFVQKTDTKYITHVYIGGERILPSDTFEIENNDYVLLKILQSTDDILFLKIIGIRGPDMGSIYLLPKTIFEEKTLSEIKEGLKNYQH